MPIAQTFLFLAPVPVGHVVRLVPTESLGLLGWGDDGLLVVDETSGILWGPEWAPELLHGANVADLKRLSGGQRRVAEKGELGGRVVGCAVRSRGEGADTVVHTTLHIELGPVGTEER